MRILLYNWVDYTDPQRQGGGVSVYLQNLMQELSGSDWADVCFLSSGNRYDLPAGAPYWRKGRTAQSFEIVNSGTLAPSHHSFGAPEQISHPATQAAFADFINQTGPYDIVHFHNLEGLPAEVLAWLGEHCPDTRIIVSLHNYYPICPQVNLWKRERESCCDFRNGTDCTTCLPFQHDPRHLQLSSGISGRLDKFGLKAGTRAHDIVFRNAMRVGGRAARLVRRMKSKGPHSSAATQNDAAARAFADRRHRMVTLLNTHAHALLCVSDAVREIAIGYGLSADLCHTVYIGTAQAHHWATTAPRPLKDPLRLTYLGHMRRDKGFYFLLDALESLPDEMAKRVGLTCAAPSGDRRTMARLGALAQHLADLRYHNGYGHDQLDDILKDTDIGVVPVLWHDNLPQVAIEMHARHIPLLTSDMGGAQELSGSDALVFRAGDQEAFHKRLGTILSGGVDWEAYWRTSRPPVGMQDHLARLRDHYTR